MATAIEQTPFVKQLAASDKPTRDAALSSLQTYLSPNRSFTPTDLLKIWKGLFYCVHHTASPLPQQRLCSSLASLLVSLPTQTFIPFLAAFWQTIGSNFGAIPSLRLDKYLLLVRHYVASAFRYLQEHQWKNPLMQEYLDLVGDSEWGPLTVGGVDGVNGGKGGKVPNGLRFHVLDVWIDGLETVLEAADEEALNEALKPVERLAKEGKMKVLRGRAKTVLVDERLKTWMGDDQGGDVQDIGGDMSEEQAETSDGEWEGFGA